MNKKKMFLQKSGGFTLLELITTTTIVAILAAAATSLYTGYVRKGRRAEAIADSLGIQIAEEKHRMMNNTYGDIAAVWYTTITDSGYYTLRVSGNTPTTYTVIATALGNQTADSEAGISCQVLMLTVNNGITTKTPKQCWEQ